MIAHLLSPRALRILLFTAAVVAFVMACLPHPPGVPMNPSDKVQHIFAFAVLTLLARLAYTETRARWLFVWLSGFGALIELAQLMTELGREADVRDWLADSIAVIGVLLLARFYRVWRSA